MIEVSSALDPGRKRIDGENQDSLVVEQPEGRPLLLVIADGMGGYDGGAIASHLVVEEMANAYQKADPGSPPLTTLQAGVRAAHEALQRQAGQNPVLARMGSTVVAAIVEERKFYLLNVGDSRAYLINQGEVRQVSYDHSLVAEQLRHGIISEADLRTHPRRNVLSMAISAQSEPFEPFTAELDWQPGDVLVLCSDGLWGPVPEDLLQLTVTSLPVKRAAEKLVDLANANQGPDNIAVILARLS